MRAQLPDRGAVDAMVSRWSPTHVLIAWQDAPGQARQQAWVPAAWVQRIAPEESAWTNPYRRHAD